MGIEMSILIRYLCEQEKVVATLTQDEGNRVSDYQISKSGIYYQ